MQLMNQNKKNSDSDKLKQVLDIVQKSGMTPEQYVKHLVESGQVSRQQFEEAVNFAKSKINQ